MEIVKRQGLKVLLNGAFNSCAQELPSLQKSLKKHYGSPHACHCA